MHKRGSAAVLAMNPLVLSSDLSCVLCVMFRTPYRSAGSSMRGHPRRVLYSRGYLTAARHPLMPFSPNMGDCEKRELLS